MVFNKFLRNKISLSIIIILVLLVIIFLAIFNQAKISANPIANLRINNQIIKAELVSSPLKEYIGLSKRNYLCPNCGMLFVFQDIDEREFVMRDMNFPLDIIFINNGKIINIAENLKPEGDKTENIYKSAGVATQVLEVNGNYCQKYNIKTGDLVSISD